VKTPTFLAARPVGQQIAERDFLRMTVRNLNRTGVDLIGVQTVPGEGDLPAANGTRAYVVNDNGTQKVWTFAEVVAQASDSTRRSKA
jgi:hypothetical protein